MTNPSKIKKQNKTSGISCLFFLTPTAAIYWYELKKYRALQKHTCNEKSLNSTVRHWQTTTLYLFIERPFFKMTSFYFSFKWSIQQRNVSPTVWRNAKRRLKNVEHHQLSVHPSIHLFTHKILSAMVCLSPPLPDLHFPFGEDVLQPDDIKQRALPFQAIQCVCHVSCLI